MGGERLKIIRRHYGLGQIDFAVRIGIKQAYLSELENGKKKITSNIISAILIEYPEIAIKWLINGMGDMFQKSADASADSSAPIPNPIPLYERLLDEKDKRIKVLEDRIVEYQRKLSKYEEL
jgi:transcriptional regulator with XRE-family HTH domain